MKRVVLLGLLVVIFAFATEQSGWTAPWGHSCNGIVPTAVSTGTVDIHSTDCDFKVTGLSGDTAVKVYFQESFANLPWCTCTDAGDAATPLAISAKPSATATLGSTQNVALGFPTGLTAVVCHCTPY